MRPTRVFAIVPSVPAKLAPLNELALNLRWCWDNATIDLFRRLDSDLWELTKHNPVAMLGRLSQEVLDAAASDDSFLSHLEHVYRRHREYMERGPRTNGAGADGLCVGYFSAEYGLTDCLRVYAGGLGMLAGDILKSASDLGVGLVGVGILHQEGYVRQYLNPEGWQQELYEENDFHSLPITLERDPDGAPLVVRLPLAGSELKGADALYSIVQMPAGIPVACMAIGGPGAKNAAYFAAGILGLKHDKIREAYEKYRRELQG